MNLNDLLKVNRVRCIKTKVHEDLVEGEIYDVEGFNDETIKIVDRNGYSSWHNKNLFTPVINNDVSKSDNEIDISKNSVDDVNTTFKVGDNVYKYGDVDVKTILEVFENGYMNISNYPHRVNHESICYATQENYELLTKLYPHIEFEQPTKELKGSDLAKALIKKIWVGFNCLCGNSGEWIDISVEPSNRTEFDSEAVLAIDVNGYTYNVTLASLVIRGETKREWTECKAKWNGEFWEAVEYICQAEKLVAYKYIQNPPSEVQYENIYN